MQKLLDNQIINWTLFGKWAISKYGNLWCTFIKAKLSNLTEEKSKYVLIAGLHANKWSHSSVLLT